MNLSTTLNLIDIHNTIFISSTLKRARPIGLFSQDYRNYHVSYPLRKETLLESSETKKLDVNLKLAKVYLNSALFEYTILAENKLKAGIYQWTHI